ncbi:MAG TPA: glycoside hydrolase family 43 protein [Kineosporiaceae bacterium]|jgi:GH43 family beta-xylosidase|nr:glycoside hydrolase family 43 protein [Kineosporiaceae bacterium]
MVDPLPGLTALPGTPARPATGTFVNPVLDTGAGRDHGDPFVLRHAGRYYLYYTGTAGIEVWTGTDLAHWSPRGLALVAPEGDHWAQVDLWAPEVLYADGWFHMYVTGTRHPADGAATHPGAGVGVNSGDDALRRQGVARSRDPLGPFELDPEPLLGVWSIDGHPFVDVDGRRWLFYNVRDDSTRYRGSVPGCGNLVDELVTPTQVRGEPVPVALPDAAWEGNSSGGWFWNEGPTVLRRRGRYVQMYSGGYYGDATYGVGFAAADSPRGPWVKAPHNPVFVSGPRITGPGHHCVTTGPDGVTPYAVYHGYVDGLPGRKVHVDRLHWSTEGPRLGAGAAPGTPTESAQPLPDGPAHDPAVPYWHAELWVRARTLCLGAVTVDLPDADCLVDVTQREQDVRVLVDGRAVVTAPAGDPARVALDLAAGTAVDGVVRSLALTTWREDEDLRVLGPGEVHTVAWGGDLPVELSLAVDGAVLVRLSDAGGVVAEHAVTGGGHLPELVRLRTERPIALVEVCAGAGGALVSDLVLTARPRRATPAETTGSIPVQRPAADS